MIKVKSPAEKRALAAALREHDPGYLEDLKMFSDAFGPMRALTYQADDPAAHERAEKAYEAAVEVEAHKSRDRALAALAAAKEATK